MQSLVLPLALALGPQGIAGDRLYVNENYKLSTFDSVTGDLLQESKLLPLVLNQGLAYSRGRLFTLNSNIEIERDFLVEVEPATGRWTVVGMTGMSLPWVMRLAFDPNTNRLYAVSSSAAFFGLDSETGRMVYLSTLEPKISPDSMAFDSKGRLFLFAAPQVPDYKPKILRADPHTGAWTTVGVVPDLPIDLEALAFDSADTLWAVGVSYKPDQKARLFTIDLDTLELTPRFHIPPGYKSIAFGPAPRVEAYCTAKTGSAGCVPAIDWDGHPSAAAHFGLEVSCGDVRNQTLGLLFLGLGGQAATPFQGGTLCVAGPFERTPPVASGGSAPPAANCTGAWSTDLNTWLYQNLPLPAGTTLTCQWWGHDPGLVGPDASQLSDALELTLLP